MKSGTNEGALPVLFGYVITDQRHYIANFLLSTHVRSMASTGVVEFLADLDASVQTRST